MKKISIILLAAVFTICSFAFAATNFKPMTKAEATQAFNDKTITTISWANLNGKLVQNSFTGYFGPDGKAMGHFANQPENNVPQDDQGTWLVKSDGTVCATWQHWFNGKELCVHIYNAKNSLVLIGVDGSLNTLIMSDQIQSGNQMSATTSVAPVAPAAPAAPAATVPDTTGGASTGSVIDGTDDQ